MPRADGRLVVGATVEERGFDTQVTAGGVHELLREAYRALPDVAELELVEAIAGLRPATPDNMPLIGPGALDGLLLATGHYRNGILLAPVTAEPVAALSAAEPADALRRWRDDDRAERRRIELRAGASVADADRGAGAGGDRRGVAVAVDGEVVPAARGSDTVGRAKDRSGGSDPGWLSAADRERGGAGGQSARTAGRSLRSWEGGPGDRG